MGRLYHWLLAVLITGCMLSVAGCVSTSQHPQVEGTGLTSSVVTTPQASDTQMTHGIGLKGNDSPGDREYLRSFVKSAVEYATINGRNKALSEYNNQTGIFVKGDRYIFAYDYNGTVIALPFQKELLGINRQGNTDPDGVHYVRDIGEMARKGGGYVEYRYPDPSRNFSIEKKVSYALDVDGTWYVGSGYYPRNETGT
ncbi:MAG: cache domain-containing protein [Methanomicrobiales archaeon]